MELPSISDKGLRKGLSSRGEVDSMRMSNWGERMYTSQLNSPSIWLILLFTHGFFVMIYFCNDKIFIDLFFV